MRIIYQKYYGFWEVIDDSIGIIVSKGKFNTQALAQAYINQTQGAICTHSTSD